MKISTVEHAVDDAFADGNYHLARLEMMSSDQVVVYFHCEVCQRMESFPVFESDQGSAVLELVKAGLAVHEKKHIEV